MLCEALMSDAGTIEVGACRDDGTARYWWAREAVRQGEMRLSVQSAAIDALMGRAGWLTGWCVSLTVALLAVAASGSLRVASAAAAATTATAAALCIAAMWPRDWHAAGGSTDWALREPLDTELEGLEALALGYSKETLENGGVVRRVGKMVRAAFVLFAATPAVGAIAFALTFLW